MRFYTDRGVDCPVYLELRIKNAGNFELYSETGKTDVLFDASIYTLYINQS